jgi:hypothetical protein
MSMAQDTPQPSGADPVAYKLDEAVFLKAFHAVQHTLICRTIGDANVYNAYLERQCLEQNAHALELRDSLNDLTCLDNVINNLVKEYLAMTNGKCQILLDILSCIDTFDMKTFHGFAVCAIDGVIVHKGLCMKDKSTSMCFIIGMKFKHFLYTFWMVKHLQDICLKRILCYVKNRKKNDTLQTLIESFNAKCNQKDDVYAVVFMWAYAVLLQSLQMTVRKLRDTTRAPH